MSVAAVKSDQRGVILKSPLPLTPAAFHASKRPVTTSKYEYPAPLIAFATCADALSVPSYTMISALSLLSTTSAAFSREPAHARGPGMRPMPWLLQ